MNFIHSTTYALLVHSGLVFSISEILCQEVQVKHNDNVRIERMKDSICNNKKACLEIEIMFYKIETFFKIRIISDTLNFDDIIPTFNRLTGIIHEPDEDYSGYDDFRLAPSKKDYNGWKGWYSFFKDYLCWDEEKQKVILKE